MRLTLLHKGLLLVSIPLCFELAIFGVLLGMQNEMAQEAARINKARMISDAVNQMSHTLVILDEEADSFKNPMQAAMAVRSGSEELLRQLRVLGDLTGNDPVAHDRVLVCAREASASQQDYLALRQMLAESQYQNISQLARIFRPKFNGHMKNIVKSGIIELGDISAGRIDTDRTAMIRNQVVFLLKCAVTFSGLIGVFGALMYSRHLIARLNKVVSNADRLGKRQPLLAPIGGNDEVAELDSTLHEAERLIRHLEQAREEVISMVSHDIRSPLTTIRYSAEALQDQLHENLDESETRLLHSIEDNCDRILRISKDLLDIQRLESGMLIVEKEKTNLKDCLLAAVAATEGMARNRSISVESKLDPMTANVDSGRIEQVVTNLMTNAIKHSRRAGVIQLTLDASADGRTAFISVSDKGRGIPEQSKEAIFDRFKQVTTEDARQGAGLGLAISKALVESHGGQIGVDNLESGGCKFWIKLPC